VSGKKKSEIFYKKSAHARQIMLSVVCAARISEPIVSLPRFFARVFPSPELHRQLLLNNAHQAAHGVRVYLNHSDFERQMYFGRD